VSVLVIQVAVTLEAVLDGYLEQFRLALPGLDPTVYTPMFYLCVYSTTRAYGASASLVMEYITVP